MIEYKTFEVRDSATFIPMLAIAINGYASCGNESEDFLVNSAGYGPRCILFGALRGGNFTYDEYEHRECRTRLTAHRYIKENWDTLKSGDVVDVEFILKETKVPCKSERFFCYD